MDNNELLKEIALEAKNIDKTYKIYGDPVNILKQKICDILKLNKKYYKSHKALKNISIKLAKGETLGIIGKNGSGKSTLLEIITGTLMPDRGKIYKKGRVAALLELGSGFNPEFTGIENIYFNAQLLGLKKSEIDKSLKKIVKFADIGDFIDKPIKIYSSGMMVRLAFAVQAHIKPDILIVDEALAVGDELFQKKCYNRIKELKQEGTSIILVTHSCQQINTHCDSAVFIHKGNLIRRGKPKHITGLYQQLISIDESLWEQAIRNYEQQIAKNDENRGSNLTSNGNNLLPKSRYVYETNGAQIERITVNTTEESNTNQIKYKDAFHVEVEYLASENIEGVCCACTIADKNGKKVCGQRHPTTRKNINNNVKTGQRVKYRFYFKGNLWPGRYFVTAGVFTEVNDIQVFKHRIIDAITFEVRSSEQTLQVGLTSMSVKEPTRTFIPCEHSKTTCEKSPVQ